jgi:hypothetical protein
MIPLSTLRARVQRLEAERPLATRRFIVVAGLEEELDRAVLAALPGQVTVILSGVPHAGLRPPTIWEMAPDGRWLATDPQELAA